MLRREIIRLFLMFRPKKKYSTRPIAGSKMRIVTQASDLTGLRFSPRITKITVIMERTYVADRVA